MRFRLCLAGVLVLAGMFTSTFALAGPRDVAPVLLLDVPGSCPRGAFVDGLAEFEIQVDIQQAAEAPTTWSEEVAGHQAEGAGRLIVVLIGQGPYAEARVLRDASGPPIVLRSHSAGCDGVAVMAALYCNRHLNGLRFGARPTPAILLLGEAPVSKAGDSSLRVSIAALGLLEANARAASPELLGVELRAGVRVAEVIASELAFGLSPFVGLDGDAGQLAGYGLTGCARTGVVIPWRQVEFIPLMAVGVTDYMLRLDNTDAGWSHHALPRGELGLQFRMASSFGLLAEAAVVWEPWTVRAVSERFATTWTIGGVGVATRLGFSFDVL